MPPYPKKKKKEKAWTSTKADQVFSRFIRERADWRCQYCGKDFSDNKGQLHNSHFYSRAISATRYDPDNCIAACYSCHYWKLETSKNAQYMDFMVKWLGPERYEALRKRAYSTVKRTRAIQDFRDYLSTLNS